MPRVYKFDLRAQRLSTLALDGYAVFSTRPYPIEVIESMQTGHSLDEGRLWMHVDTLDSTHGFISGQLRAPLQYATIPTEALDSTHSFSAGVLRQILKTYNGWAPESLDSTHAFASGVLKLVLIRYQAWPAESIDSTHSFVSGALT